MIRRVEGLFICDALLGDVSAAALLGDIFALFEGRPWLVLGKVALGKVALGKVALH